MLIPEAVEEPAVVDVREVPHDPEPGGPAQDPRWKSGSTDVSGLGLLGRSIAGLFGVDAR